MRVTASLRLTLRGRSNSPEGPGGTVVAAEPECGGLGRVDGEHRMVRCVADDVLETGLGGHVKVVANDFGRPGQHRLDYRGGLLGSELGHDDGLAAATPAQCGFTR